jgi:SET domain
MLDDTMTKEIQRANARTAGSIEIRHVGKIGWGIFALKDFEAGDLVLHPSTIAAIPSDDDHDDAIDEHDNTRNKEDKEDVAESANNTIPEPLTAPTAHTLQIDWKKHVLMNLPTRFLNHKCGTANVGIHGGSINENGVFDFFALIPIKAGDEITFDYETTEFEMLNGGFDCHCVSPICRGKLRGFMYSADAVLKVFDKKHIAPYLHGFKPNGEATLNL